MRIRELFTVPEGKKITEKLFGRVLLSSVCSILLCAACLISTTWAWFSVSIENTGNIIEIGTPKVSLTVDDAAFLSGAELPEGTHKVTIEHASEADALQQKSTLYVTLLLDETTAVYTLLGGQNPHQTELVVNAEKACRFSWSVSWFPPANADLLEDSAIHIAAEETAAATEETTVPMAETTAAAQTTVPSATPAETTMPSATETTAAPTETTAPTQASE